MRYCHECGFQVQELDIFCSSCGIALPKVEATAENETFSNNKDIEEIVEVSNFDETKNQETESIIDESDGVEDPQDWWVKTDEVAIADALKSENQADLLPTIEKYSENTETEENLSDKNQVVEDSEKDSEINNFENHDVEIEDENSLNLAETIISPEFIKSEESVELIEHTETEVEKTVAEIEDVAEISQDLKSENVVSDVENLTETIEVNQESVDIEAENEETDNPIEENSIVDKPEFIEDSEEVVDETDHFQNTVSYNLSDIEQLKLDKDELTETVYTEELTETVDTEEFSETIDSEVVAETTENEEVVEKLQTENSVEIIDENESETVITETLDESSDVQTDEVEIIAKDEIVSEIESLNEPIAEKFESEDVKDELDAKLREIELIKQEVEVEQEVVVEQTVEVEKETDVQEPESQESETLSESNTIEEVSENKVDEILEETVDETLQEVEVSETDSTIEEIVEENNESAEILIDTENSETTEIIETTKESSEIIEETQIEISESENIEVAEDSDSLLENLAPVAIVAPIIAGGVIAANDSSLSKEISENEDILEDKEGRSYTNPINQGNDTGGKRAKLQPLAEGIVLNNRYEVIRKIGGGGMGAVYLASDRNLGGVLRAVKEMVQSYIEEDAQEKAVQDFKRESLLLTSLDHQAIPTIFDYFLDEKESRFYLVMKYISGGDLGSRLRSAPEGKVDEKTITEWAIQVADVLDYLHRHEPPIVYRDLKPSNVMVDGNSGRIMLIDFGIARWVNKEEKGVTAVGTMGYAPPELFSGNVEPRSDIYSLGSTMFHLLTGADPQNNPLLIFDFNKNPRPRQINSQISDQMEQILMRAVEYNVEGRFSSAAEIREVLIGHLDAIRTGRLTFGVTQGVSSTPFVGTQLVFCGFCGQKIVASDMFCPFCGAKQPSAQQSSPMPTFDVPKLTAKLFVISTNDLEAPTYGLEKDSNLIGRRDPMSNIFPEVDLSKYDPQTKISRRHARIWRENDTFMIEDLGSSNGTILISTMNDTNKLLPHTPKVLAHGDKLKLGDTILHFVVG